MASDVMTAGRPGNQRTIVGPAFPHTASRQVLPVGAGEDVEPPQRGQAKMDRAGVEVVQRRRGILPCHAGRYQAAEVAVRLARGQSGRLGDDRERGWPALCRDGRQDPHPDLDRLDAAPPAFRLGHGAADGDRIAARLRTKAGAGDGRPDPSGQMSMAAGAEPRQLLAAAAGLTR